MFYFGDDSIINSWCLLFGYVQVILRHFSPVCFWMIDTAYISCHRRQSSPSYHAILSDFPSLMVMYQPQIPRALRLCFRGSLVDAVLAILCKFSTKYLLPFWNIFTCLIARRSMFVNTYLWLAVRLYLIVQRFILRAFFIW